MHHEHAAVVDVADDGERAALALARWPRIPASAVRLDGEHVALLRLVAPDLHAATCQARRSAPRAVRRARRDGCARPPRAPRSTGRRHRRRESARWDFRRPSAQQVSITSCARRWISALPRCTEAKSRSAVLAPLPTEEAAPPPRPISMAGPPRTTSFAPDRHLALLDMRTADVAQAAGDHDGLVIATHAIRRIACHVLLEGAEVAADRGPAELVVERGGADRPLEHDLERRGDARGPAECALPRPLEAGNAQVRDREPGEPGLGLCAAAGRALVADLAARAGRRARKRRDRGRMVVRLDLDQDVDRLGDAAVDAAAGVAK